EKAEKEKAEKEKAEKEKAEKEKADKEKADKEKADKEKADKEKTKTEKEKTDKEKKTPKEEYNDKIKETKEKSRSKADDIIENTRDKVDKPQKEAFERGREVGEKKVKNLEEAYERLKKNPNDPEAKKAFDDASEAVQKDKHAMHVINDIDPGKPHPLREAFNKNWRDTYDVADKGAKQRIADKMNQEYYEKHSKSEVPRFEDGRVDQGAVNDFCEKKGQRRTADDIEVLKISNTPVTDVVPSEKSTYDRDVTYRDKKTGSDVPTEISKDIYHEEFYKARHDGELPRRPDGSIDREAINKYAKETDQTVTDLHAPDAYGASKKDGKTALTPELKGRAFDDIEATTKAMEFKTKEWYEQADHCEANAKKAESSGNPREAAEQRSKAEGLKEEGMRQLTKQFGNQVEALVNKVNEITGYPEPSTAHVPEDLRVAVDIMNRVGKKGPDGKTFTTADAEAALKRMQGRTPEDVAHQMSGVVESLQKHLPSEVKKKVDAHFKKIEAEMAAKEAAEAMAREQAGFAAERKRRYTPE
ncbi:MAG: hypothetical protein RDV48_01000, partial [Candidatus Eremiobacteraeota bacterium]|nr:hypothetical protein [Candidatus Eremiobacteraeota bacterium]